MPETESIMPTEELVARGGAYMNSAPVATNFDMSARERAARAMPPLVRVGDPDFRAAPVAHNKAMGAMAGGARGVAGPGTRDVPTSDYGIPPPGFGAGLKKAKVKAFFEGIAMGRQAKGAGKEPPETPARQPVGDFRGDSAAGSGRAAASALQAQQAGAGAGAGAGAAESAGYQGRHIVFSPDGGASFGTPASAERPALPYVNFSPRFSKRSEAHLQALYDDLKAGNQPAWQDDFARAIEMAHVNAKDGTQYATNLVAQMRVLWKSMHAGSEA
jgi:hypothetical protein